MRHLIRFLSFRSYYVAALAAGISGAGLLALDGFSVWDGVTLAAYAGASVWLQRRLHAAPPQRRQFDAVAAFDRVLREGRPTLLEFYSEKCAASLFNRPLVDQLERAAGHRLQILRVSSDDAIGLALANRYQVNFTPTFILFNERGEKEDEFLWVVNRGRVLYWLSQHQPRDTPSPSAA
jgi:hypothetical protein